MLKLNTGLKFSLKRATRYISLWSLPLLSPSPSLSLAASSPPFSADLPSPLPHTRKHTRTLGGRHGPRRQVHFQPAVGSHPCIHTAATLRFHARTFTVSEVPRRINNGSLRVLTQAEAPGCLEAIRVAGSCSIAIRSIRITEVIIGT